MTDDVKRDTSPCVWYRANACPLVGNCSPPSWKKASCKGWTKEEVRERVYKHLVNSTLHQTEPGLARECANAVKIEEVVWTESEAEAWEESIAENEKNKTDRKQKRKAEIHDERRPSQAQRVDPSILRLGSLGQIGLREAPRDVEVRIGQVRNAVDSLSRGAEACDAAGRLLAHASKAFAEESERMKQCRDAFLKSLDES